MKELEERKIKAEETQKITRGRGKKRTGEIERENLKEMEERVLNSSPKQEKIE